MLNTVIISSLAEKELQNSFDWYAEQQVELGVRFLNQIEVSIAAITDNPKLYPVKVGPYRQYVVSIFPFVIVYEYIPEEHLIYVLHIFHASQNPSKKLRRS